MPPPEGNSPRLAALLPGPRARFACGPRRSISLPATHLARAAIVERALRIGGLMEYAVRLAEGPALVVQEQQRHGVPARTPGTPVGLMLCAEHGRFLPD